MARATVKEVQYKTTIKSEIVKYSPKWRLWLPKLHKACEATESATTIITMMKTWKGVLSGNIVLFTSAWTHIFEGQHNGCNDASNKYYDPQDTEKALALCEVHLERKTTNGHVITRMTAQIHCGHLKQISTRTHTHTHTPLTFVWKQKTVTAMQTTAVIPKARNTAFVS